MGIPACVARYSWRLTIKEQRYRLETHLDGNPSLRTRLDDVLRQAYRLACLEAEREIGLQRG
ncbi:MAG: DUF29 family protein [Acetobacteraceae bacterium]